MSSRLTQRLEALQRQHPRALTDMLRGIEREGLRADPDGFIAQTDHPYTLGAALTHPSITTDYSEALLELITPVNRDAEELLNDLRDTHAFVHANLPDGETFWAASMPCRLDGDESVRIAEYGQSNIGTIKHVYRRGLWYRYGRIMQSIAGVHFNFSMGDVFWNAYHQLEGGGTEADLQEFRSDAYFSLIRNFRRWSWLLMYLFGASPALDRSFLNGRQHELESLDENTLGSPYATSLRMSGLGYQNNAQSSLKICFNHLSTYLATLYEATHVPYAPYEKIGVKVGGEYRQLNTNLLQIENEYYNSIRPKRVAASGEKPIQALQRRGVEYVEVRCLDLNPFSPVGVEAEQIRFLDVFLLTCLLDESPLICDDECALVDHNFSATVERGRDPGCLLRQPVAPGSSEYREVSLHDWALELLEKMTVVAEALDGASDSAQHAGHYQHALRHAHATVSDPALTPSAKLMAGMQRHGQSFTDFVLTLSRRHQQQLLDQPLTETRLQEARRISEQSWLDEQALVAADTLDFDEFLQQYLTYN